MQRLSIQLSFAISDVKVMYESSHKTSFQTLLHETSYDRIITLVFNKLAIFSWNINLETDMEINYLWEYLPTHTYPQAYSNSGIKFRPSSHP
jgi:hypothetical protein